MIESEVRLKHCLDHIDTLEKELSNVAKRIFKAGDSQIHKLDYFALSIINRAISLNRGYKTLVETENTLSAIGLLRLQLDNLIRYNAFLVCENPLELMEHILDDKPLDKYRENDQRFTDSFLVKKLDDRFPKSYDLYKYLCNYIHYGYTFVDYIFHEKEIPTVNSTHRVVVGDSDNFSLKDKIDYIENLIIISVNLITLMNQWAEEKDAWINS